MVEATVEVKAVAARAAATAVARVAVEMEGDLRTQPNNVWLAGCVCVCVCVCVLRRVYACARVRV